MNVRGRLSLAGGLSAVLCAAPASYAAQITGKTDAFAYVAVGGAEPDARTTSTTFVPMLGMALDIRSQRGPAVLLFCGKSLPEDIVIVEALVDGVLAQPGTVVLDAAQFDAPKAFTTHCFNFAVPRLECGDHHVEMQFKSLEGAEIRIQERSLTALYNDRGKARCH